MKTRKVDDNEANDMISFPPDTYERPKKDFTCLTCAGNLTCEYAYDWYNTDGNCLAIK